MVQAAAKKEELVTLDPMVAAIHDILHLLRVQALVISKQVYPLPATQEMMESVERRCRLIEARLARVED